MVQHVHDDVDHAVDAREMALEPFVALARPELGEYLTVSVLENHRLA